jgi:polar amino acid transport system permease protein/octopine/nopaline transport system permease protein/arginine/ornithine transport system permease protein
LLDLQGYGWLLLKGLQMTVLVGLCAMGVAILFGLLGTWGKFSHSKLANWSADTYTTVVRGVPELILLLLVYYGVPKLIQDGAAALGYELRLDLNPFVAGFVTIGFIYGAFCTEVLRGAFLSVPRGQMEAARAIGMSKTLAFRRVQLPLAMRMALPGLGNVWLVLIKATALISLIQLDELMRNAKLAATATHQPFTFYFLASLLFLGITLVSMLVLKRAETWAKRGVRT